MSTSPNMLLPIPVVGVTEGPEYADLINSCLSLIDTHDHSTGKGVPVTPAGLSITSDLAIGGNNLTSIRSLRLNTQLATLALPTDLQCIYSFGGNLYYNNGGGTAVQLTNGGSVAGTSGSIGGLVSPASATYVSATETFVWQAAANKPANMDFAAAIFRNNTVSSFGCTVSPPAAMGADYSLTLPSLPVSQKIMTLDASGNMSAPYSVDNVTLEIASNTLRIKDLGVSTAKLANDAVTTAKILDANVTRAKLVAVGQQISSSSGAFSTTSLTVVDVTNLTVTITTTGRPVMLMLTPANSTFASGRINCAWTGTAQNALLNMQRGGTNICLMEFAQSVLSSGSVTSEDFTPAWTYLDPVAAGTYTYKIQAAISAGTLTVQGLRLVAYEL